MDKRLFLQGFGASVGAVASSVLTGGAAQAQSGSFIVYIGANNCPGCRQFKAWDMSSFKTAAAAKGFSVREVQVMDLKNIRAEEYWPSDLKPLLAQFSNTRGTPRFLVVTGGKVRKNIFGIRAGKKEVGIG